VLHLRHSHAAGWREQLAAAHATQSALDAILRTPNADDRKIAQETLDLHKTSMATFRELYNSVDRGSADFANTIQHESGQPRFAATQAVAALLQNVERLVRTMGHRSFAACACRPTLNTVGIVRDSTIETRYAT
jgi:hypothetical protein